MPRQTWKYQLQFQEANKRERSEKKLITLIPIYLSMGRLG